MLDRPCLDIRGLFASLPVAVSTLPAMQHPMHPSMIVIGQIAPADPLQTLSSPPAGTLPPIFYPIWKCFGHGPGMVAWSIAVPPQSLSPASPQGFLALLLFFWQCGRKPASNSPPYGRILLTLFPLSRQPGRPCGRRAKAPNFWWGRISHQRAVAQRFSGFFARQPVSGYTGGVCDDRLTVLRVIIPKIR